MYLDMFLTILFLVSFIIILIDFVGDEGFVQSVFLSLFVSVCITFVCWIFLIFISIIVIESTSEIEKHEEKYKIEYIENKIIIGENQFEYFIFTKENNQLKLLKLYKNKSSLFVKDEEPNCIYKYEIKKQKYPKFSLISQSTTKHNHEIIITVPKEDCIFFKVGD